MVAKKVYNYNIAKFDFFKTAVADILRAIDGGAQMGAAILAFCCIDYMGMAIDPSKDRNTGDDFKKFVSDYMGEINSRYKSVVGELWAVRNSLVHVYGESDATKKKSMGFEFTSDDQNTDDYGDSNTHLRKVGDNKLSIDIPEFVGEIVAAVELFFRKNKGDDNLLSEWYKKLLIIQSVAGWFERLRINDSGKREHVRSHRLFKVLDDTPEKDVQEVARAIRDGVRQIIEEL